MPLFPDDVEDLERSAEQLCELAGVPPFPRRRMWFLRPIGGATPEDVCDQARRIVGDGAFTASPALTSATRTVISRLTVGP